MKDILIQAAAMTLALSALAMPASADCNAVKYTVQEIALPAHPFGIVPSADGCTIFVSLAAGKSGGAVVALKRNDGIVSVGGADKTDKPALGLALTHDGSLLLAATDDGIAFYDTAKLTAGDKAARLGHFETDGHGAVYVAVTPDDKYAFVSNEWSKTVAMVDLVKARATGFSDDDAVIGKVPVGKNPVGLAFSPDGTVLYATSEVMWGYDWPGECQSERKSKARFTSSQGRTKAGRTGVHADQGIEVEMKGPHREGALFAIDVAKAATDPDHAVLTKVPAGCNPVRVVPSPDGARLFVSVRGDDMLRVFDAAKLRAGDAQAEVGRVAVGESPIGVAVTSDGRVVVTNSRRFDLSAGEKPQNFTVIDAVTLQPLGTVEVGGFPREVALTADGRVLLVANYGTKTIKLLDLSHLPMAK